MQRLYIFLVGENMYYETNVYWNTGTVKKINQDSVLVLQALSSRGRVLLSAVCDGMGGMEQGEYASGYVTEELIVWFYDGLLDAIGKKKPLWIIRRSLERKIYQIQRRMQDYAGKRKLSMGTTMSVLILWEKRYLLWHLGDSRIYRFFLHNMLWRSKSVQRKYALKQITKDHVQGKNKLTKCVGSFGFFVPDFKMGIVRKEEAFLLCSDGFWHRLKKVEIGEVLRPEAMTEETSERRLKELAEAAMRRGEKDNISAVYIKCR